MARSNGVLPVVPVEDLVPHPESWNDFSRLVPHLPGVQKLVFLQPNFVGSNVKDIISVISQFTLLKHLSLGIVEFDTFEQFIALVCSFPILEDLSLSAYHFTEAPGTDRVANYVTLKDQHSVCLKKLELDEEILETWAAWLMAPEVTLTAQSLNINRYDKVEGAFLARTNGELFFADWPCLQELTLTFDGNDPEAGMFYPL